MKDNEADPIVEEVRAIRNAYSSQINYDIVAMCDELRARQEASNRQYVSFRKSRIDEIPHSDETSMQSDDSNDPTEVS